MRNITAGLALLAPLWTQIADISGVPGVSIGVVHEGNVVFQHSIGYRDLEEKLPTTGETIYPIASLSKAFTATIYGSLVDQGVLDWESPISEILPDFHSTSPEVERHANAVDLLSHRTGLIGGESFYYHAQPLLNETDLVPTFGALPLVKPFRTTMQYNNLGYGLVGQAMSVTTGKSYGDLLETFITQPLGMHRTGVEMDRRSMTNRAKKYLVAEDGTAIENQSPLHYEKTSFIAAGGIWSCVNDLLVFYKEVLRATSQDSPLKQLSMLLTGHTFLPNQRQSLHERTYGLGWIRTQLPDELGAMGGNSWLVKQMPVIGRKSPSRLAIYHQGNVPGATSAVYLFPETSSGVVVLANGYGLSDVPDWIAQSIIESLFEEDVQTPFLELAEETVSAYKSWCAKVTSELAARQQPSSAPALDDFVGVYWNAARTFRLVVVQEDEKLSLQFQGLPSEAFNLKHSSDDIFSWFGSARGQKERGRNVYGASYYLLDFQRDSLGAVTGLRWAHDGSQPGELFEREADLSSGLSLFGDGNTWALVITAVVMVLSETALRLQSTQSRAFVVLGRIPQAISALVIVYILVYQILRY